METGGEERVGCVRVLGLWDDALVPARALSFWSERERRDDEHHKPTMTTSITKMELGKSLCQRQVCGNLVNENE
jgi:hypothetical protein